MNHDELKHFRTTVLHTIESIELTKEGEDCLPLIDEVTALKLLHFVAAGLAGTRQARAIVPVDNIPISRAILHIATAIAELTPNLPAFAQVTDDGIVVPITGDPTVDRMTREALSAIENGAARLRSIREILEEKADPDQFGAIG